MSVYLGDKQIAATSSNNDDLTITENSNGKMQSVGIIDQNDNSVALKQWSGTKAQYDALVNADAIDENTLYNITDGYDLSQSSRNIGEIIQSTIPLKDACLHLLDGSLLSGYGIHKDFVDYIKSLYSSYPSLFCTETQWNTTVNTYGVCGKFVYNVASNTVRLPKITGFTESTLSINSLGSLTQAGLPNITGRLNISASINTASGAFEIQNNPYRGSASGSSNNEFVFDASRSSPIYGNSSTVQPQSIKVLYYIVIATGATNQLNIEIADAISSVTNMETTIETEVLKKNSITNVLTKNPYHAVTVLSNNQLILKSGSTVFYPNGFESDGVTRKFIVETIPNDIVNTDIPANTEDFFFYQRGSDTLAGWPGNIVFAQPTQPSKPSGNWGVWYDLSTNTMKAWLGATTLSTLPYSLPFCRAAGNGTIMTSILERFYGVGYIGKCIFVMPDIEGLAANGLNKDGTYNNIVFGNDTGKPIIMDTSSAGTYTNAYLVMNQGLGVGFASSISFTGDNYILLNGSIHTPHIILGKATYSSGTISGITRRKVYDSNM